MDNEQEESSLSLLKTIKNADDVIMKSYFFLRRFNKNLRYSLPLYLSFFKKIVKMSKSGGAGKKLAPKISKGEGV